MKKAKNGLIKALPYLCLVGVIALGLMTIVATGGGGGDGGGDGGYPPSVNLTDPNIYVYGQPPVEYLQQVNATQVTWSVYWSGLNNYDKAYLDNLHNNNITVGSNFATVQGRVELVNDIKLIMDSACNDINGNLSICSWITDATVYLTCHNNPSWQQFLKDRIEEHVDGNADIIHLDELEGSGGNLDIAGFCDYCMSGFNQYLKNNFSAAQLSDRFGISDINTFNYRTYLLDNSATTVWDDPNSQLKNEFLTFQYKSSRDHKNELIQYAKNYASRQGKQIFFSGNTYGLLPQQQIFIPYLDLAIFEKNLERLPEGKYFWIYFLGDSISPNNPMVMFPDIFNLASLSSEDFWLWKHWLAEASACGKSFLIPYNAYTHGGGTFTIPADDLNDYTSFILDISSRFTNCTRLAKVAILYDFKSTIYDWQIWLDFPESCLALQEEHIPFEIIYIGDGNLIASNLSLQDLTKYSIIIVPNSPQLQSATTDLLNQYALNGGNVIRLEKEFERENLIQQVQDTNIDLLVETTVSKQIGIVPYQEDQTLIVHLVNYNYDYTNHNFVPEHSRQITLTIPDNINLDGKEWEAIYYSPDFPDKEVVPVNNENRHISLTIPIIDAYGVVILE